MILGTLIENDKRGKAAGIDVYRLATKYINVSMNTLMSPLSSRIGMLSVFYNNCNEIIIIRTSLFKNSELLLFSQG